MPAQANRIGAGGWDRGQKEDAGSTSVLGEREGAAKSLSPGAEGVNGGAGPFALDAGNHGLLDAGKIGQLFLGDALPPSLLRQPVNQGRAAVKH